MLWACVEKRGIEVKEMKAEEEVVAQCDCARADLGGKNCLGVVKHGMDGGKC